MSEEQSSKAPWYFDAIKNLGLPTCFLAAVLYMIWTAGTWAGKEIIFPLFEKQTTMIDEVSGMVKTMEGSMQGINKTLEAHGSHAVEALKICNETRDCTKENGGKLDVLSEKVSNSNENMINVLREIEKNTSPIKDLRPSDMP
jgi:hypothetical protein